MVTALTRFLPPRSLRLGLFRAAASMAIVACGTSNNNSAGPDGGLQDGSRSNSLDGSSTTDASRATTDGSAVDGGVVIVVPGNGDAAADAASPCQHLNIGILGNPGHNASSNFQAWLVSAGTSVTSIQTDAGVPLLGADLAPFDVVILNWLTRDYTATEAAVFASWVTAGGGVISMSGFDNNTTDDWHANSLLAPLAVAYADPFFVNGPVTDFVPHPITAGLTSVTFTGGYAIDDLGGDASAREVIAFIGDAAVDGGEVPVGYAVTMGAGHGFIWGDEWIQFDSQWTTIPQIKQLWVQTFEWVAPVDKCVLVPPQ